MTLLAEPLTTDPVAVLHACLDDLAGLDADRMAAGPLAAVLDSLTRAEAKIAALRLSVLTRRDVATRQRPSAWPAPTSGRPGQPTQTRS